MKELEQIFFEDRNSFRLWLKNNHHRNDGFWMLFYKKHTNKVCISYREALEEALCFGWIDSIVKRIDEESYVRKFTPRRDISNWSDLNKSLVVKLIDEGKMTEAGLNKIDVYLKYDKVDWDKTIYIRKRKQKNTVIPEFINKRLIQNPQAWKNFNNLAESHKRQYVDWIGSAKKEETKLKRLNDAINFLQNNDKLGIK